LAHLAERRVDHGQARMPSGELQPAGYRVGVTIEGQDLATRTFEDGPAVAATTERGVDVNGAVPQVQCVERLVDEHGPMCHSAFPQARYQQRESAATPRSPTDFSPQRSKTKFLFATSCRPH